MTLIINLAAASYLAGLFWYVQIVHYQLFNYIDKKSFIEYYIYQQKKSAFTIFIPMLLEGAFSILLAFDSPYNITPLIPFICLCLSTGMWLITFSHIAPLQDKLISDGLDKDTVKKLIEVNWLRTIGWTVKTLLLIYCLSRLVFFM